MTQYLNRKYTFIEFLSDSILISNLINVNKIKTIFKIDNNVVSKWEFNSSFNSFNSLEKFKTYLFINKEIEPSPLILHNNNNLISTNHTVSQPMQMISYKGYCPNLNISYFRNQISAIYKVKQDGLGFDAWFSNSRFNTFNTLTIGDTYLLYSRSNFIPYSFVIDPLYSSTESISLNTKCDSIQFSSYLGSDTIDNKCFSGILSDTLSANRCISNVVNTLID